jgi:hypothetical protein
MNKTYIPDVEYILNYYTVDFHYGAFESNINITLPKLSRYSITFFSKQDLERQLGRRFTSYISITHRFHLLIKIRKNLKKKFSKLF